MTRVGATLSYSVGLHSVRSAHVRSAMAVAGMVSYRVRPQTVSGVQTRLVVVVGASISYSSLVHVVTCAQMRLLEAVGPFTSYSVPGAHWTMGQHSRSKKSEGARHSYWEDEHAGVYALEMLRSWRSNAKSHDVICMAVTQPMSTPASAERCLVTDYD